MHPMASRNTLLVITGPAAVGKMTVGQELARLTGMPLLFNHMVVDLVTKFAPFGTPRFHRLAKGFTSDLIDVAAEERRGLILTHGLVYSLPNARAMLDGFAEPFVRRDGAACFVELAAPLEVRLERNATENRAQNKDVSWSTPERLREMEAWGAWYASEDFTFPGDHIRIANSALSAAETAVRIRDAFSL